MPSGKRTGAVNGSSMEVAIKAVPIMMFVKPLPPAPQIAGVM